MSRIEREPDPRWDEVCDLREQGFAWREVAQRMGLGLSTVQRILRCDTGRIVRPPREPKPAVIRVYRLRVARPEGSEAPGWEPEGWSEICVARGWTSDVDPGEVPFTWPRRLTYLSAAGAEERAKLLREYGATVVVERSLPVEWEPVDEVSSEGGS